MREKLSAFVVSYNRATLVESCLGAASFADELIVVDKSSSDGSAIVASRYADRVEVVPWSPVVEETRAFALSLCRNEWVLFLDDDEVLSPNAASFLCRAIAEPDVDIYTLPLRHYILGVHDERAYYWPEAHPRLFRKGAIEFVPVVHGGVVFHSSQVAAVPVESGVCIHHLSHPDVASFVERTNRYTNLPNRVGVAAQGADLAAFAHGRIDEWISRTDHASPDGYPAAVAVLRAVYDIVDRLKTWEGERGLDGAALFRAVQARLAVPAIDRSEDL